ncbi:MAG: hypothetical protein Ct9H300mP27_02380 [Chloroflexota bacterium]|nr:MAG: hypothetical protein Ct9H300mP27_02380 [Chloroflexota bacterium]
MTVPGPILEPPGLPLKVLWPSILHRLQERSAGDVEIPYTDYTGAEHTIFAIMAALIHRQTTGAGQFIDVSQTETSTATIPEFLMDYFANKELVRGTATNIPAYPHKDATPAWETIDG